MELIGRMSDLKNTANQNDDFIEGYKFKVQKDEFSLFVMEERTETQRGFILKIMFGNGTDRKVDLSKTKKYSELRYIFDKWCNSLWINRGKTRHCYKYVVFGKDESHKHLAITVMRLIVCDIIMSSPI